MNATILITVLALGAPGPKGPPAEITIVGDWLLQSVTVDGKTDSEPEKLTLTFTADGKVTFRLSDGRTDGTAWSYVIDIKAKPSALDITLDPGEPEPSMAFAIVKINGETLTLCMESESPRPTRFEAPKGSTPTLSVFQRVKAK